VDHLPQLPLDGPVLQVHSTATLAADVPTVPELWLQPVRATPKFYRRPHYSNVAVHLGSIGRRRGEGYAQLRALMRYDGEDLAFVRWYEVVDRTGSRLSEQHGCQLLKWATRPAGEVGGGGARYSVIALESVLRSVSVLPCFEACGSKPRRGSGGGALFCLTRFVWGRRPSPEGVTER
jgi:hypothetical protein